MQIDTHLISPEQFFRNIRYVTLKITPGCNLRCKYCNVEPTSPRSRGMSLDVFKRIADLVISNSSFDNIGLEFHGGEPLLLPDSWFEEAVGYVRSLAAQTGKKVFHPMQTNGTLLDLNRLRHLTALGINIGISYDGPAMIANKVRGGGSIVERNLEVASRSGLLRGLLLVLSPINAPHIYRIMENLRHLGIRRFRINFLQPQGWGKQMLLSAEEMLTGMVAAFEHMVATDCSVVEIGVERMVRRYFRGRRNPAPLSCWEYECQAGRTYVAIDHEGKVFACGTDLANHQLGTVYSPLSAEWVDKTLRRLHLKDPWFARCTDCEARKVCSQSCATTDFNSKQYREEECAFTLAFHEFLYARTTDARRILEGTGSADIQPTTELVQIDSAKTPR